MRGISSTSLGEVLRRADAAAQAEAGSAEPIAGQLFAMADAIDESNQLVRLLSDAGRPAEVREHALRALFTDRVGPQALDIAVTAVRQRWSEQNDVLEALERAGVVILLVQADRDGVLDRVEEELFQVSRLIDDTPELSQALSDRRRSGHSRTATMRSLLEGRVHPLVADLAGRAVARDSAERPARRVEDMAHFASSRRQRLLGTVTSARQLDESHLSRLRTILARIYGQDVHLNLAVDPEVVGGLRIQVGDDLYDATVLGRLSRARARLAS